MFKTDIYDIISKFTFFALTYITFIISKNSLHILELFNRFIEIFFESLNLFNKIRNSSFKSEKIVLGYDLSFKSILKIVSEITSIKNLLKSIKDF